MTKSIINRPNGKGIIVQCMIVLDSDCRFPYNNMFMKPELANYDTVNTTLVRGKDFDFPSIERISQESLHAASRVDWHSHKSIEVIVCIKGVLDYELRHRGRLHIPGGNFTVIPAGIEHRHIRGLAEPGRRFGIFLLPVKANTRKVGPLSGSELRTLAAELLKKRLTIRPVSTPLLTEIHHLADLTMMWDNAPSVRMQLLLRARMLSVLAQLSNAPNDTLPAPGVQMMDEATRWLSSHYREHVNIDELIRYIGYGRSRFFALFRQNTGLSPNEWLIRYRINKAKELLSDGKQPIAKVASSCGFNDAIFFARIFRNRLGISPSDYRRQSS